MEVKRIHLESRNNAFKEIMIPQGSNVEEILIAAGLFPTYRYMLIKGWCNTIYGDKMIPPITERCICKALDSLQGRHAFSECRLVGLTLFLCLGYAHPALAELYKWNNTQVSLTTMEWFWSWLGHAPARFLRRQQV